MFTREQCVVDKDTGETGIITGVDTNDLQAADPVYYAQFGVPRNSEPARKMPPGRLRAATSEEVMDWRASQGFGGGKLTKTQENVDG